MAKRRRGSKTTSTPSTPLTAQQVKRLRSLRPITKPPRQVELTPGQFKLPRGSKATLVRIRGSRDRYRVRVTVRGSELGRRLEYDSIPTERIDRRSFTSVEGPRLELMGFRPEHLRVDHLPGKVALRKSEIRLSPVVPKTIPWPRPPDQRLPT